MVQPVPQLEMKMMEDVFFAFGTVFFIRYGNPTPSHHSEPGENGNVTRPLLLCITAASFYFILNLLLPTAISLVVNSTHGHGNLARKSVSFSFRNPVA